jgi:hypothetical protein
MRTTVAIKEVFYLSNYVHYKRRWNRFPWHSFHTCSCCTYHWLTFAFVNTRRVPDLLTGISYSLLSLCRIYFSGRHHGLCMTPSIKCNVGEILIPQWPWNGTMASCPVPVDSPITVLIIDSQSSQLCSVHPISYRSLHCTAPSSVSVHHLAISTRLAYHDRLEAAGTRLIDPETGSRTVSILLPSARKYDSNPDNVRLYALTVVAETWLSKGWWKGAAGRARGLTRQVRDNILEKRPAAETFYRSYE